MTRVVLSTIGKFHTFDLARQLHQRGMLEAIFTGYPRFKLRNERLPNRFIKSFPWFQTVYMAKGRFGLNSWRLEREMAWWSLQSFDAYTAARLPRCDIFMGLSGGGLKAGLTAKKRGSIYICDRGSSHICYQDRILQEEFARHGQRFAGIDPRVIAKEEAEYRAADLITVPSLFAQRSFLEMGVPASKVRLVPYGVDLSRFYPVAEPDPLHFDVLFVGGATIRKGIPDLLKSFACLYHPGKRLTLVGTIQPEVEDIIRRFAGDLPITCTGHCPQPELKEMMSRSHVLVLPSLEDGLGLVMAQAMACGCPVIGSTNTGAQDLFTDGSEGFIVPIRAPGVITERMQFLADYPDARRRMSAAALERVKSMGGWDRYGEMMAGLCRELAVRRP